jgi:large subunit ribosomal protein L4
MKVQSYEGGRLGSAEFDAGAFGTQVLYRTLKDAVVMYHANARQGTAKVKTRAEVHGSHKKPWKQKHTGRARAGDKKSPLWRKGGTIFGPRPRDFSYHMPRTAKRVALRSALYGKLADGEVVLATLPRLAAPSAKAARKVLADLGAPRRALVLLEQADVNVWKSFRNFPGVVVKTARDLNARDVVNGGTVIAERGALVALATRVGTQATGGGA